jgi:hypothetical protein
LYHDPLKARTMKTWRKVHMFSLGYVKGLSLIVAVCMFFISITGFLLNHRHDFRWVDTTRVPTAILPPAYQQRLDQVREAQGLAELFPDEAHSVPLQWLITDFHTGEILGPYGPWFYDLIAASFTVLSITGIVMFFKIRRRKRF